LKALQTNTVSVAGNVQEQVVPLMEENSTWGYSTHTEKAADHF